MVCITIAWNEQELMPIFLNHYEKICDKIIVYDNESDDKTSEICDAHPLVERRVYKTNGEIRDDVYLDIKNQEWKNFKHGCHACYPSGSIVYEKFPSLKLLHCKNIGGWERLEERRKLYEKRLSDINKQKKMGA